MIHLYGSYFVRTGSCLPFIYSAKTVIKHLSPIFNQHSHGKTYIHRTYTETLDYCQNFRSYRLDVLAYVLSPRTKGRVKTYYLGGKICVTPPVLR